MKYLGIQLFAFFSLLLTTQYSEKVKELTIHIEDINKDILKYDELESLTITFVKNTHCGFEYIPEVIFELTSLKELHIESEYPYGRIKEIPKSIGNLIKLERLSINGEGDIKKLPQEITHLKKLKYLSLLYCGVNDSISLGYITKLKQLEELVLAGNDITFLPQTFSQLQNLKKLDLSNRFSEGAQAGDPFEQFPVVICELKNLKSLDLRGHHFSKFPKELKKLNLTEYSNYEFLNWFPYEIWKIENKEELFIELEASKNFRVYKITNHKKEIIHSGYWLKDRRDDILTLFAVTTNINNKDLIGDLLVQNKGILKLKIKNKTDNSFAVLDLKTRKTIQLESHFDK